MSDPTPETGIQEDAGMDERKTASQAAPPEVLLNRRITIRAGTVFGAFAGAPIAGLCGALVAWFADQYEFAWLWAIVAAPFGMLVGAVVGAVDRVRHGDVVEPNIGTWTGIWIGLIPALVTAVGTLGITGGTFLLFVAAGFVFVGPTIGLLVGASMDRAYSEAREGHWPTTVVRVAITLAASFFVVPAMEWVMTPSTETVEKDARKAFSDQLRLHEPDPAKRRVQKVALTYVGSRKFVGEIHTGSAKDTTIWDVTIIPRGGGLEIESVPRNR